MSLHIFVCCERLFCLEEIEVIRVAARGHRLFDRLHCANCCPLIDRNEGDRPVALFKTNIEHLV